MKKTIFCLALCLLLAAAASAQEFALPGDGLSCNADEWKILRLTNIRRAEAGLPLLTMAAPLQQACDLREAEIKTLFDHVRPDGSGFYTAIPSSLAYKTAGENICEGDSVTAADAVDAWMNSASHRANLLSESYGYLGAGASNGAYVQLFADRGEIVSAATSAGGLYFDSEQDMLGQYLICTDAAGVVSFLPLDTQSLTKTEGGYLVPLPSKTPIVVFVGGRPPVFDDVAPDAYYAQAVAWAIENGITTGTSATAFSPDAPCTRAQILTFLWRAAGAPAAGSANGFSDLSADDYYYQAALWAGENGMTDGPVFAGDLPCARSAAVSYLWQYAGSPDAGSAPAFDDVSPDAYYAQAVAWAIENGVTTGTSAAAFSPGAPCTRAQILTFLWRALR